jgi:hypothetical protein
LFYCPAFLIAIGLSKLIVMKNLLVLFLSLSSFFSGNTQWSTNPSVNNMLCSDAPIIGQNFGNDHYIRLLHDGNGGAFITWFDYSDATPLSGMNVQLQHISSTGITWPGDGITVTNADYNQRFPEMAPDGSGGVVVTWYSDVDGKTYAQRVDINGNPLWAANGIPVCSYPSGQLFPNIIRNENGNVTIVWKDTRAPSGYAVYAQQLDMNGNLIWNSNGVEICSANVYVSGVAPVQLVSDGNSGVIAYWYDTRSGFKPFLQRLLSTGTVAWVTDGVPVASVNITAANMIPDGSGGVIVAWADNRSPFNYDIYAQRFNGNGNAMWAADGAPVCVRADGQFGALAVPDGNGGAFIAWNDNRDNNGFLIYAQYINAAGITQWISDGIEISNQAYFGGNMKMTPDGMGGMLITWNNISPADLRAQRINTSGSFLFPAGGAVVCNLSSTSFPEIIPLGSGNSILAWVDYRNAGLTGIFGSRLLAGGTLPVHFSEFYGQKENSLVRLKWSTMNEQDNLGFDIERSDNGISFQKIGFTTALPATSSIRHYQFTDQQPLMGKNYYRLKQYDRDGNFKFSSVILIRYDEGGRLVTLFPNPASTSITIQKPFSDTDPVIITDAWGRFIRKIPATGNSINIDISALSPGIYYCRVSGQTLRFVRQPE